MIMAHAHLDYVMIAAIMNKYTLVDVKPAGKFAVELNSENAMKFALKMGDDMKQFDRRIGDPHGAADSLGQ